MTQEQPIQNTDQMRAEFAQAKEAFETITKQHIQELTLYELLNTVNDTMDKLKHIADRIHDTINIRQCQPRTSCCCQPSTVPFKKS